MDKYYQGNTIPYHKDQVYYVIAWRTTEYEKPFYAAHLNGNFLGYGFKVHIK